MSGTEKNTSYRFLMLITNIGLADRATEMFTDSGSLMLYRLNATGTASSDMIDILGLGSTEKVMLIGLFPKNFADKMLVLMKKELKLGAVNSGIGFTVPMSGANSLVLKMLEQYNSEDLPVDERKVETLSDKKYSMIAAVVDQGHSEEVMNAAREAGAGGGSILHSRRIADEKNMKSWGFSVGEEKEIVLIVTDDERKLAIMQAIGKQCGMHSECKGSVLSLPIDKVIGLDEF